jgi:HEAT repeat protein
MKPILTALAVCGLLLGTEGLKGDKATPTAKPVSHWVKQLKKADVRLRQEAAEALGELGPKAEPAIPALIEAFKDWRVRRLAARALAKIGPKAIPELIKLLEEESGSGGKVAGDALARFGAKAVPDLIKLLKGKPESVRQSAIYTLGKIGPKAEAAIPALVGVMKQKKINVFFEPVSYLADNWTIVSISGGLKFRDEILETRFEAAIALAQIGSKAMPSLVEAISERGWVGHGSQKNALAQAIVQAAVLLLVPKEAGSCLAEIRNWLGEQLYALDNALQVNDERTRWFVMRLLGWKGSEARAAVPILIRLLKDKNPSIREKATEVLAQIGPDAKAAILPLLRSLEDETVSGYSIILRGQPRAYHYDPWDGAVKALMAIGPEAESRLLKEGVPILVRRLKTDTDYQSIVVALAAIGPKGKNILPIISKFVRCNPRYVPYEVIYALGEFGSEGVPALVSLLKAKDATTRGYAVGTLGKLGRKAEPAVPALIKAFKDKNDEVRLGVVQALRQIRPKNKEAIAALIQAVRDSNWDVRRASLITLRWIKSKAKDTVGILQTALHDTSAFVVAEAAYSLLSGGVNQKETAAVLTALLEKDDEGTRAIILGTLERLGQKARPMAPVLVGLLNGRDVPSRIYAAKAVCRVDPKHAREALPVLVELLKDESYQDTVIDALQGMGPAAKGAVPALITLLDNAEHLHRKLGIINVLRGLGQDAKAAIPALTRKLSEEQTSIHAADALGQIGPQAKPAIPMLKVLLKADEDKARSRAAQALASIDRTGAAVLQLKEALRDESGVVRVWAAYALTKISGMHDIYVSLILAALRMRSSDSPIWKAADVALVWKAGAEALGRLGPLAKTALPELKKMLKDSDEEVRIVAVCALADMGPVAKETVPELIALLKDPSEQIRAAAVEALGKMGPAAKAAIPRLREMLEEESDVLAEAVEQALAKVRRGKGK